ncbi:hypothetical protein BT96DRAFT_990274 [Gymnopus androsaceus JB14]|uniref:Uncharacterized protein n=1 Tax=Gymnopus androsaceus JB14 TaxID=1447944 RepID=A0A6A4I3F9_9AGAR|nr:hypothetical protein BT96DRAFT_990274 [Gymnopus androsaceus JB14]
MLEVQLERQAVFVLEIRPSSSLQLILARQEADDLIRRRLADLVSAVYAPRASNPGLLSVGEALVSQVLGSALLSYILLLSYDIYCVESSGVSTLSDLSNSQRCFVFHVTRPPVPSSSFQ